MIVQPGRNFVEFVDQVAVLRPYAKLAREAWRGRLAEEQCLYGHDSMEQGRTGFRCFTKGSNKLADAIFQVLPDPPKFEPRSKSGLDRAIEIASGQVCGCSDEVIHGLGQYL